ncbi:MAG: M23 family metallopeptidase [Synechococcus sp.]
MKGWSALAPLALLGVVQLAMSAPAVAQDCADSLPAWDCEAGFDYEALIDLMESAGFAPEEIEQVVGIFQELEEQALDYAETNRLWQQFQEEYLLDYASVAVIQAIGEIVYRTNPLTRENFDLWRSTIEQLIPEYAGGLGEKIVERMLSLLNFGVWGKFDVPLGEREGYIGNTISGSDKDGFNVPCDRLGCAHIEFSTQPVAHGKRWIWGEQEVNGGYGWPLGELNGGKEPTGRHPITDGFKVVLLEVDEVESSAQFGTYFRICIKTLAVDSCSPYFIGPFPWFGHREKDWILLGTVSAVPAPPTVPRPIPTPPLLPGEIPAPEPAPSPTPPLDLPFCHDLSHPASGAPVTSEFGPRVNPVTGQFQRQHSGIDLGTPMGTPIRAACDGVVMVAAPRWGYGNYVVIDHGVNEEGNRLTTGYAHLSRIDVAVGQPVTRGEVVGLSGNSGLSTGPHLHFETYKNWVPQNPRNYVEF